MIKLFAVSLYPFAIFLSILPPLFADEPVLDPSEIWKKVIQANTPWLSPQSWDVYYEMDVTEGKESKQKYVVWSKGVDKTKVQSIREGNTLFFPEFNNGTLIMGEGKNQNIQFNVPHPHHIKSANLLIAPFSILMAYYDFYSFKSAQCVKDGEKEFFLLESNRPDHQIQLPFFQFPFTGTMECLDPRIYVDSKDFHICKEELYNLPFGNLTGEFPDGFYKTEGGFAPKSYRIREKSTGKILYNAQYEMADKQHWMLKENQANYGNIVYTSKLSKVSFASLDNGLFTINDALLAANDPNDGTGTIKGKLLDFDTHQPVTGANVKVIIHPNKTRNPLKAEKVTGEDGGFEFTSLPPSEQYYVIAEKEGYLTADDNPAFNQDPDILHGDLIRSTSKTLSAQNPVTNLELFLAKPRLLRGKVIQQDSGSPIAGAEVFAYSTRKLLQHCKTDKEGAFTMEQLPAQKIAVAAWKEKFAKNELLFWVKENPNYISLESLKQEDASGMFIDLQKNTKPNNAILQLIPANSVEGYVRDRKGNPVDDAVVSLTGIKTDPAKTDMQGHFIITNFTLNPNNNRYGLSAKATGFVETATGPIVFSESTVKKDIILDKGGKICGIILGGQNQPLPGIQLKLQFSMSPLSNRMRTMFFNGPSHLAFSGSSDPVITNTEGKFQTNAFTPGIYEIVISANGQQPYKKSGITVEDEKVTDIRIQLQPSSIISGIVTGPSGTPLTGVQIQIQKYDPSQKQAFTPPYGSHFRPEFSPHPNLPMMSQINEIGTNEDGRFSFSELEPGVYRIIAMWTGMIERIERAVPSELIKEDIKPGYTDIQFHFSEPLKTQPVINGMVIDAQSGSPVKSFQVRCDYNTVDLGKDANSEASSIGKFSIYPQPEPFFSLRIIADGYAAKNMVIANPEINSITDLIITLHRPACINGKVLINHPELGTGIKISLLPSWYQYLPLYSPEKQNDLFLTSVEKDNSFAFHNLAKGTYDLIINKGNNRIPIAYKPNLSLEEGQILSVGDIPIGVSKEKTIALNLQARDGQPMRNAHVLFPQLDYSEHLKEKSMYPFPVSLFGGLTSLIVSLEGFPSIYHQIPATDNSFMLQEYDYQRSEINLSGVVSEKSSPIRVYSLECICHYEKEPVLVYNSQPNNVGRFDFTRVEPGKVFVVAKKYDPNLLIQNPIRFIPFELDALNCFMKVEFGKGYAASGVVKNKKGNPVPGARVFLMPEYPHSDIMDMIMRREGVQRSYTDAHGKFSFDDVNPGKYSIWALTDGDGLSQKRQISIEKQDCHDIDLGLE